MKRRQRLQDLRAPPPTLLPELLGLIIAHCQCLPSRFFYVSKQWSELCTLWSGDFLRRWITQTAYKSNIPGDLTTEHVLFAVERSRDPVGFMATLYVQRWSHLTPPCALYVSAMRYASLRREWPDSLYDARMGQVFLLSTSECALYELAHYKHLLFRQSGKAIRRDTLGAYTSYRSTRTNTWITGPQSVRALKPLRVSSQRAHDDLALGLQSTDAILIYYPLGIERLCTALNAMGRELAYLRSHLMTNEAATITTAACAGTVA